jgi:hypothetical protein
MARGFDDLTDRIDYTALWNMAGSAFSISFWTYRTQTTQDGYFFSRGEDDASVGFSIWHRGSGIGAGSLELYRPGSGNSCRRWSDAGELPANAWHNVIMTHDGTFTDGTTIHIYVDNSEVSYGGSGDGTLTEATYAATYWPIGGRYHDDLRNYGGRICEMAIWNRVVNDGERGALAARYSPEFFQNGIQAYWRLVRGTLDRVNGDYGTLDGTSVVDHPPMRYPAGAILHQASDAGCIEVVATIVSASTVTVTETVTVQQE